MMLQLAAIVGDTLREAWDKKVLLGIVLSGTLAAALLQWYAETVTQRGPHTALAALAQSDPRYLDTAFVVRDVLAALAAFGMWIQIAAAVSLLMGLLASLLSAERNALLAAAPVARPVLLVGRYAGLLLVSLAGIAVMYGELWVAAGWRFGVWHWPFLAGIGLTLLAVSGTMALLLLLQSVVDSGAVAIVLTTAVCLLGVGAQQPDRVRDVTGSAWLGDAAAVLGKVLPQFSEIGKWMGAYIKAGVLLDATPLWMTGAGILVSLGLSGVVFARKEF
ncbi:MAG: hypothetical protein JNK87_01710 [Bryobacterales bacterium]|nr:hypothetical protein [Bryobacterales bacterium]